ncbi:hypothetical protein HYW58_00185 [Candidatus Kaiserbacteria bacterium]|nr:hypothetical protein [Candidatus Kaiserbacteria bacterium]
MSYKRLIACIMKETRGRKPKIHKPIDASFDEVLGAIAHSKKKTDIERKKK